MNGLTLTLNDGVAVFVHESVHKDATEQKANDNKNASCYRSSQRFDHIELGMILTENVHFHDGTAVVQDMDDACEKNASGLHIDHAHQDASDESKWNLRGV